MLKHWLDSSVFTSMFWQDVYDREPPPRPPELNFCPTTERDFDGEPHDLYDFEMKSLLPTFILEITTDDDAFNACYSFMTDVRRGYCKELGYVDLGNLGSTRIALMKCAQGPAAAQIAAKNAAEILNPKLVLFVGACASMSPSMANLGDVLISSQLANYDDKKVLPNGSVEFRGTKPDVSRNMANLILHAADGWKPPLKNPDSLKVKVHRDAVMLSGSDLVDNHKRREELQNHFPDAIGLENEGAGLYKAAHDLGGIEWAVVKGVSNFADGSKKETEDWKLVASAMAASVVYNMFKHSVVLQNWPHYKGT